MSTGQADGVDDRDIEALDDLVERALSGEPLDAHVAKLPPGVAREADLFLEAGRLFAGGADARPAIPDPTGPALPAVRGRSIPEGKGRVGSYVLIEPIGRGGQGEVWLAIDERLGRRVAVKLLDDRSVFSSEARRRLLREATVTSQLDHPGICVVHEIGEEAGVPFIAMRLVEGKTVDRLFDPAAHDAADRPSADTSPDSDPRRAGVTEPRLPDASEIGRLLVVFEEAARALHVAHEAGVVHRDIKPRNIMVTESGQAVLLDFGLASHEKIEASLTRAGDLFGTPAYLSPEQLSLGSSGVDRRTDLWSLGVSLYECLTLARPFEAATRDALYQAILTREPEDPRRINGAVPRDLATVVLCSLEKDRNGRYQTALAFAEDLRRVRAFEPIEARPAGPGVRLRRWVQRNPALATATFGLFTVLVVGLTASLLLLGESKRERTAKERALEEVTAERNEKELALIAKTAALSDYDRLGDLSRLQRLKTEADALWPCEPTLVAALKAWIEQGVALARRLDEHAAVLEVLRKSGRRVLPEPRQGESRSAESRPVWLFASDAEQFKHDTLAILVPDLTAFVDPDPTKGLLAGMLQRLAFSESVERETIGKYETEWANATQSIADTAECPEYNGLELARQLGLIPIGKDPTSRLWEFVHLQTADRTDPVPKRGPDGKVIVNESMGLVFVLLPGGTFRMGATKAQDGETAATDPNVDPEAHDNESPITEVTLDPFFMSKYEMTQGQWLRVVGRNPSGYPVGLRFGGKTVDLRNPVEQVTLDDCTLWLTRLGLVLPTEAQWEYAARGGTTTPRWTGIGTEDLSRSANLSDAFCRQNGGFPAWTFESWDDGHTVHAPVGSFAPNPFGLHDVLGNVWEWCRDRFAPYGIPVDEGDGLRRPSAARIRVLRGGSFANAAAVARSSYRHNTTSGSGYLVNSLGVRPARSVSK